MEKQTHPADDGTMLDELLDDLDAITGMIERTHQAVAKGKAEVRLIPRTKPVSIVGALDELGDILTRRTLAARAQRALRDGQPDATMSEVLDELNT